LFKEATKCSGKDRMVDITFWGGEPLIRWEMLKNVASYAKGVGRNLGIPVQFSGTTNGTLLTPDKFDFLDSIGCKFLVSLDGTKETHDLYRKFKNGESSHEIIVENLKAALERWKDYRPRMGLLAERVDHFFEDVKFLFDLGCQHVIFSPIYEGDWTDTKWDVFVEQGKKLVDYIVESNKAGKKIAIQHFDGFRKTDSSSYPCGAGRFYVGVDIDGAIYPCHRFNKFNDERPWQEKETCIGHIDHGITRPEFRQIFIDWEHNCGDCGRLQDTPCHGGCYAVRFDLTGSMEKPALEPCKYVEAQKKVSNYLNEKLPIPNREGSGHSCICNFEKYCGPLIESESRVHYAKIDPEEKLALSKIFSDISSRLSAIEKKLELK